METVVLTSDEVEALAEMGAVVEAVEAAFGAYARGDVQMPAKSYIDLPQYNGDFRSMPAYMRADGWEAAGVKWVNVHPDNPEQHDLPTVMGIVVYADPATAYPLAIMDGTTLTMKRTGAAAAVATRHLAVEDASSMGLIGAGTQAYTQLEAVAEVRPIEEVVVSDPDEAAAAAFVAAFDERFDVRTGSVEAAAGCDVLSTVTPVESPIVTPELLGERTHVNAIGADAAGKHELADEILLDARLVIDDYDQTTHSGEINVPYGNGTLVDDDIDAELGEIVIGEQPGRTDADRVTVFDSTGLAIQDVAAAHVVYEEATERGEGRTIGVVATE